MNEEFLDILTADALRFDEYAEESKDHSGRARSVRVTGSSRPSSTAVKQIYKDCEPLSGLLPCTASSKCTSHGKLRDADFPTQTPRPEAPARLSKSPHLSATLSYSKPPALRSPRIRRGSGFGHFPFPASNADPIVVRKISIVILLKAIEYIDPKLLPRRGISLEVLYSSFKVLN